MRCVKSIDELYEEVREFDLVITTDAALATALNARIDKPIVGPFALTPKQIASHVASRVMDEPLYSELRVISAVSVDTGLNMKYVHSEIENIKEIRQYTKDVKKYLHSEASKAVYDSYEPLPTLERLMGAFIPEDDEFFKGISVAVIEEELFNDLDKHFIPIRHESVSIFRKGQYGIDRIFEIGNDRQLAANAVDLIANPYDFAIVLNTSSPITDAVRASLYRKHIPFINSLNVRDLSQIRDYLQFISLAMDFDTIRVKHVKELFSNYNGNFKKGREEFLLCKQTEEDMFNKAQTLWRVMRDIRTMTYSEVCEEICDKRARIQVNLLIEELGVSDTRITSLNLSDVKYAVDNVKELRHSEEIPENEKKGVLLVDCNNSVYIDRPVVIYLGMEQDWNKSVIGKQYLDVEDETDKNVMRLNALIQQGTVRYYLVNSTKGGKPARPSMLFDLLYKMPVDTFAKMCPDVVKGRWHKEAESEMPEDPFSEPAHKGFDLLFSKSSFNDYYACPRRFLYSRLLSTPEEKATEFGNLIHAFAEFYTCYPQDVRDLTVDYFLDLVSDRYSGLSSPLMSDLDRSRIRHAMNMVMSYIDLIRTGDVPLDRRISDSRKPNQFMMVLGKDFTSSVCEEKLVSKKDPIYGLLDLYLDGTITDYKTGKPNSVQKLVAAMSFDPGNKEPEFQPLIYLALALETGTSRSRFDQFYVMDNDSSCASGDDDFTANIRSVEVLPGSIKEIMTTDPGFIRYLGTAMKKDMKDHATEIMAVISDMGSDDPEEWRSDHALVTNILAAIGKNDNSTNRRNVVAGMSKIVNAAKDGFLFYGGRIVIPVTTVETFLKRLRAMHSEMLEQSLTGFPAAPRVKCDKCRYFQVCTKEIIELGGASDE